uniref:Uncharacterized protein n=1 Tax=Anopheles atroparvus TaxID=41427 RepID=A0A182J099_ANOAO
MAEERRIFTESRVHEARDSPSKVPPSANPAYRIEAPAPPDGSGMPAAGGAAKEEEIARKPV